MERDWTSDSGLYFLKGELHWPIVHKDRVTCLDLDDVFPGLKGAGNE